MFVCKHTVLYFHAAKHGGPVVHNTTKFKKAIISSQHNKNTPD